MQSICRRAGYTPSTPGDLNCSVDMCRLNPIRRKCRLGKAQSSLLPRLGPAEFSWSRRCCSITVESDSPGEAAFFALHSQCRFQLICEESQVLVLFLLTFTTSLVQECSLPSHKILQKITLWIFLSRFYTELTVHCRVVELCSWSRRRTHSYRNGKNTWLT